MTTEPTEKHREAREPERIRVCVRHGKDDWIGIAYSTNAGDPDAIHEYVSAEILSAEIREVLEGLRTYSTSACWCSFPSSSLTFNHESACLAARALYERLRPVKDSGERSESPRPLTWDERRALAAKTNKGGE